MKKTNRLFIASFLGPALLFITVFVAIPAVRAFLYSLQKWDGFAEPEWVGLENFHALLFESDLFLSALGHNAFLMATGGAGVLSLSLFFAAVLHRRVRGAAIFRVAFFFPNVIASVAIALLFVLLYSTTEFGLVNGLLQGVGLLESPFPFLDKQHLIYAIVPMMIWTATGFYMVLFLAAMEGIPETYYEAARLDGASEFAQFWNITLPLIREVLTVGMVFLVISCLKLFEAVWIMDNEWPTKDTHVLSTLLYQKVFSEYNVGYGSAVSVVLFVLVFCATLVTLRLSRREALEY